MRTSRDFIGMLTPMGQKVRRYSESTVNALQSWRKKMALTNWMFPPTRTIQDFQTKIYSQDQNPFLQKPLPLLPLHQHFPWAPTRGEVAERAVSMKELESDHVSSEEEPKEMIYCIHCMEDFEKGESVLETQNWICTKCGYDMLKDLVALDRAVAKFR